ncbi:hypothetical protein LY90DRAFT_671392 [Neocallimastix californiae]|jgi:protein LTV1|uniref:Low temperature viability protein n=1 Tax=Neocallimastix californiae TaxID=1754190 RepID=A0A1Y2CGP9_9FUNG|nr:hypothetical protein LY90DRAFT_671392 [Neocallimastix californiae]|eukprot:ORY46182.1 hypothetical protein LY90DRAFT_671392 [Neocallimastix californiae]
MGKKPFIDKKTARHYEVVHRSQRDPLLADENASKFVLKQVAPSLNLLKKGKYELRPEDDEVGYVEEFSENEVNYDYESIDGDLSETDIFNVDSEEEKEPLKDAKGNLIEREAGVAALYGIDFDDTKYDYMQHLKVIGEDPTAVFIPSKEEAKKEAKKGGIQFLDESIDLNEKSNQKKKVTFQLPEEALPSKYEEEVGLMNREDSDILTANPYVREVLYSLDDPNAIDENMEDDFVLQLNAEPGSDEEEFDMEAAMYGYEDEDEDDDDDEWAAVRKFKKAQKSEKQDLYDFEDDEDERRTGLTGFSMSSSAMFRNKHLTLLDDRFERVINQYDDDNIGELDPEAPNVRGNIDDNDLPEHYDKLFDEFLDSKDVLGKKVIEKFAGGVPSEQIAELREELKTKEFDILKYEEEQSNKKEKVQMIERELSKNEKRERNNWDCETIITTYTNIYNHPKMIKDDSIKKIHVTRKGLPIVEKEVSEEEEEEEEYEVRENKGVARNKKETKEEKKARKAMVKNAKKERREAKKATKKAFKKEHMKQEKIQKTKEMQERTMKIE